MSFRKELNSDFLLFHFLTLKRNNEKLQSFTPIRGLTNHFVPFVEKVKSKQHKSIRISISHLFFVVECLLFS